MLKNRIIAFLWISLIVALVLGMLIYVISANNAVQAAEVLYNVI